MMDQDQGFGPIEQGLDWLKRKLTDVEGRLACASAAGLDLAKAAYQFMHDHPDLGDELDGLGRAAGAFMALDSASFYKQPEPESAPEPGPTEPTFYERFIEEVEAMDLSPLLTAVATMGELTRAAKRAQMVVDGELNPAAVRKRHADEYVDQLKALPGWDAKGPQTGD